MNSVYEASVAYAFAKTLGNSFLRPASLRCQLSIFHNFFFMQFCSALLPRRIPVSRVDHPLDLKIPFAPKWVNVYTDFVPYWIRALTFILRNFGRRSLGAAREFIVAMGRLYAFAGEVYGKNLSTTDRPFYVARPKFFAIHLLDPHLMCIPSLHVAVVVFAHAKFAAMLEGLGAAEKHAAQIEEMRRGALAICRAILFVKQHSVNCIGASLYAMTRFDPELFPSGRVEEICGALFDEPPPALLPATRCVRVFDPGAEGPRPSCSARACAKCPFAVPEAGLPAADAAEIVAHVGASLRGFIEEGKTAKSWEEPILNFLRRMPRA